LHPPEYSFSLGNKLKSLGFELRSSDNYSSIHHIRQILLPFTVKKWKIGTMQTWNEMTVVWKRLQLVVFGRDDAAQHCETDVDRQ